MHFEKVGVVRGLFHILFKDEVVDAVIVQSDVSRIVDASYIDQKLLSFFSTHGVPEWLEVTHLKDPFFQREELEDFCYLLTPLKGLSHFFSILLMPLPQQRRKALVGLNWEGFLEPA